YADSGRPSIPPERLLRALLLQAFYTIRSEIQLMEQLDYNLLYRWFVGLGVDEPVWVPTVFTKNRERLLEAEGAHKFLAELLNQTQQTEQEHMLAHVDALSTKAKVETGKSDKLASSAQPSPTP